MTQRDIPDTVKTLSQQTLTSDHPHDITEHQLPNQVSLKDDKHWGHTTHSESTNSFIAAIEALTGRPHQSSLNELKSVLDRLQQQIKKEILRENLHCLKDVNQILTATGYSLDQMKSMSPAEQKKIIQKLTEEDGQNLHSLLSKKKEGAQDVFTSLQTMNKIVHTILEKPQSPIFVNQLMEKLNAITLRKSSLPYVQDDIATAPEKVLTANKTEER